MVHPDNHMTFVIDWALTNIKNQSIKQSAQSGHLIVCWKGGGHIDGKCLACEYWLAA